MEIEAGVHGRRPVKGEDNRAFLIAVRPVYTGPSLHKSLRNRVCLRLALLLHGAMKWSCPMAAHTLGKTLPKAYDS